MNEDLLLIKRLEWLRAEHRERDKRLQEEIFDDLAKQRIKREKLMLHDQIVKLEHIIYPDIPA